MRLRRPPERNTRERPWRSRLRSSSTRQHVHDMYRRQQFNSAAEQELNVPRADVDQPVPRYSLAASQPIAQPPTTATAAAVDTQQHGIYLPLAATVPVVPSTPSPAAGRRRPASRKVLLLVQRQCEHSAPIFAIVANPDIRLRRQCQLQPFSAAEVCLQGQLLHAVVVPAATAATTVWWCWLANEHSIRRQHHGRIAHLKDSRLGRRRAAPSRTHHKNKRDLLCQSSRPSRV